MSETTAEAERDEARAEVERQRATNIHLAERLHAEVEALREAGEGLYDEVLIWRKNYGGNAKDQETDERLARWLEVSERGGDADAARAASFRPEPDAARPPSTLGYTAEDMRRDTMRPAPDTLAGVPRGDLYKPVDKKPWADIEQLERETGWC